jgi:citrate lyase subunit beta / citryl-CoA lyase
MPRRSLLFAPAADPHKLVKAVQSAADAVIVELEDGVGPADKDRARLHATECLTTLDFGARERMLRINAADTPWFAADLRMALDAQPDTLLVPKVETVETVQMLDEVLADSPIRLIIMAESARALLWLRELASASARIDGIVFGAEDYAASVGATRTQDATEVLFARSQVVAVCAAFGIDAIDLVCNDIHDHTRLADECRVGAQLGFVGKQAIHPAQLEVINAGFTPAAGRITWARRVIEGARAAHGAAFVLDGQMIDRPIVRQAERLLTRAS